MQKSRKVWRGVGLGVAALCVPILPFLILGELPGQEWLSGARHPLQIGLIGAGLLAVDVVLPVPSTLVGSALGARLGLLPGLLWCWTGLLAGNLAGYALGALAARRASVELPEVATGLVLLVTRPVPILAEAVAIAAGAGRVSLRVFLCAALLGNGVLALALAASGVALLSEDWAGVGLAIPLGLPVLGWLGMRRLRRRPTRG